MAKNYLVGNISSKGLTGGTVSNSSVSSGIAGDITNKTNLVQYTGGTTNTATVNVDNSSHIITVDAKIDVEAVEAELKVANQNYQEMKTLSEELKTKCAELSSQQESFSTDLTNLKLDYSAFKTTCDEKFSAVNQALADTIEIVDEKVAEVESQLTSLQIFVQNQVVSDINSLKERVTKCENDIADTKAKLELTITQVSLLQNSFDTFKQEINTKVDTVKTDLSSDISSLSDKESKDIAEVKTLIGSVETDVAELKKATEESLANLSTKVDNFYTSLDTRITSVKKETELLVSEVDTKLTKSISELKESIESSISSLSTKVDDNYTTLDTRITTVKGETDKSISNVDEKLTQSVATLQKEIDELSTKVSPKIEDINKEIQALKDGKVSIETFNAHVTEASKQLSDLKEYVDKADASLTELFDTKLADKVSNATLQETVSELKKYTDDAIKIVNNDFQPRLANIEQSIVDLNTAVEALQSRQTALENRMDEIIVYFLNLFEEQKKAWYQTFSEFKQQYEDRMTSYEAIMDAKYELLKGNVYNRKPECMYYDTKGTHDPSGKKKSYWYMSAMKDDPENTIIAGPYDFGTGGGGGGGTSRASQIYFDDDILVTKAVGYIPEGLLASAGQSVEWLFNTMLTKVFQPTATNPSATITCSGTTSSEVGNTILPTWNISFNAGKYTYGPATGCTSTYAKVIMSDSSEPKEFDAGWVTGSGNFVTVTYGDESVTKSAKISEYGWTASTAIAVDSIGNQSNPPISISASSGQSTGWSTRTFTGYRNFFYGCSATAPTLDSSNIRKWDKGGQAYSGKTFTQYIDEGSKFVYIAILESTGLSLLHVKDENAFGTDIVNSFKKQSNTVMVEGANGYTAKAYNVWIYDTNGTPLASNTYEVSIGY